MAGPIKRAIANAQQKSADRKAQRYTDKKMSATQQANAEGAKDFMKKGGTVKKKMKNGGSVKKK